jgi:hypothetical protein
MQVTCKLCEKKAKDTKELEISPFFRPEVLDNKGKVSLSMVTSKWCMAVLKNKLSWVVAAKLKNNCLPKFPWIHAFNHLAFGSTKLIRCMGDKVFWPLLFMVTISNMASIISSTMEAGYLDQFLGRSLK